MKPLPIHPVAEMFPALEGDDYAEFVADLKAKGLQVPIWTYQGHVIDGRNRQRGCLDAGIPPRYQEWDGQGSLTEFVLSMNLQRRQLTISQRAMVVAIADEFLRAEAATRRTAGLRKGATSPLASSEANGENKGKSAKKAADMAGVSRASVERARVIRGQGIDEVQKAVHTGKVTVTAGEKIARHKTKAEQLAALKEEMERAKAVLRADTLDSLQRWRTIAEKLLRQMENHDPPMPRLADWARKGVAMIADEEAVQGQKGDS